MKVALEEDARARMIRLRNKGNRLRKLGLIEAAEQAWSESEAAFVEYLKEHPTRPAPWRKK
jgi:hypothetical protein